MNSLSQSRFLILAAVCFAALFGLQAALRSDPQRRNYEIFTEMVYSAAAESQTANEVLPGGRTEQPLVAGVVVRGRRPLRFGPGEEEAGRAGRELVSPFASDDPDVLARGAEVYRVFCVVCHGADGASPGPVVLRGMLPPPPLQAANAMQMEDGTIFHLLTFGKGNMASYATQVSEEDRWRVIRYVRQLQETP